jgi:hypothetical protein
MHSASVTVDASGPAHLPASPHRRISARRTPGSGGESRQSLKSSGGTASDVIRGTADAVWNGSWWWVSLVGSPDISVKCDAPTVGIEVSFGCRRAQDRWRPPSPPVGLTAAEPTVKAWDRVSTPPWIVTRTVRPAKDEPSPTGVAHG